MASMRPQALTEKWVTRETGLNPLNPNLAQAPMEKGMTRETGLNPEP